MKDKEISSVFNFYQHVQKHIDKNIQLNDLIRIQADRAYCDFILDNGKKIKFSKPMKNFEEALSNIGFIKIHKSHIINKNHIVQINNRTITLSNNDQINIAHRIKKKITNEIKRKR